MTRPPIGAVIFASMGVDGVHYCIVPKEGYSIDESPVYVVSPSDGEDTVVWAAKNILDFLSIGAEMGNFLYVAHGHTCSKKEFGELLELSWEDSLALTKRYGWGVHSDVDGKIAIYKMESADYKRLSTDENVKHVKAMHSNKK